MHILTANNHPIRLLLAVASTSLLVTLLTGCTEEEFSSTFIDLEPPCATATVSWDDGGSNTCSADISELDQGGVADLTDIIPPSVGIATFRCDNESWIIDPIDNAPSCGAAPEGQRTLAISLTADDSSRVYEYVSDVFAEIGQGWGGSAIKDGYFFISELPEYFPVKLEDGGIGVDHFPFEGAWDEIITIAYNVSGLSGIGTEHAPIVTGDNGATGDFNRYITGEDFINVKPYPTAISVNSGSIELFDGQPTRITSLDTTVTFTIDAHGFNDAGFLDYDGPLIITNDAFTMRVGPDDPILGSLPPPRYADYLWEATGVVNPVSYP